MTDVTKLDGTGYALSRFNAVGHGILSRHALLPWEHRAEYDELLANVVLDHDPAGATQLHLVEEIAGVMWRKRRLRLAEASAHRRGLMRAHESHQHTARAALAHILPKQEIERLRDALTATVQETKRDLDDVVEDTAMTNKVVAALDDDAASYQAALKMLRADTRDWWEGVLSGDVETGSRSYSANAEGLRIFLEKEVLGWLGTRKAELENRPLICQQAFGDSLNIDSLERLARYEAHLDRKLEKMLGMLYRLKELAGESVSQKQPAEAVDTAAQSSRIPG